MIISLNSRSLRSSIVKRYITRILAHSVGQSRASIESMLLAVTFRVTLDDQKLMQCWTEDISKCTPEEISRAHVENRAWYKDIQRKANAMVDSRLAKEIGQDEYLEKRKVSNVDVTECARRAKVIVAEITSRELVDTKRPVSSRVPPHVAGFPSDQPPV